MVGASFHTAENLIHNLNDISNTHTDFNPLCKISNIHQLYRIALQPTPTHSKLLQPTPDYSRPIQPTPGQSNSLQPTPGHSNPLS